MRVTVDANVFSAHFREADTHHLGTLEFFEYCEAKEVILLAPVIVLSEVAGALARARNHPRFGEVAITRLFSLRSLRLRHIDLAFAETAARLAAKNQLRGADAIYLAVARETKSPLLTWDAELLDRSSAATVVMTPSNWAKMNAGQ